jgi:hypothetical protein
MGNTGCSGIGPEPDSTPEAKAVLSMGELFNTLLEASWNYHEAFELVKAATPTIVLHYLKGQ